ncbi:MAG: ATP-dependent Clp protease ATP-binding subunit, partial [Candidatus Cloacimonetes bacterium]|nr:ATP-dependent Clp protease ATP-binding subunit [Candidatus Cloacimonadota bacterium]
AYFGSDANMLRFDMSEFGEAGLVANFTLRLCDAVCHTPFTVILLDEIEKAIPEIHNLLLQVLDEGRLTDPTGKEANFTNTMIIGTSNVYQKSGEGKEGKEGTETRIRRVLERFFRPELINRFDGIIVFDALTPAQMIEIAKLELAKLTKRLEEKQIEISFSDEVASQLAKEGYDPEFGARPLRRIIMEKIEDPVSKKILSGRIKAGQKLVVERLPLI